MVNIVVTRVWTSKVTATVFVAEGIKALAADQDVNNGDLLSKALGETSG